MLWLYLAALDDPKDREVFLDFYRNYRQLMYRVALKILKERYPAEDAVHDAFLSVLDQTAKLRSMGRGQKEGFAVLVARNKAVDILRRERPMEHWEDLEEDTLTMEVDLDESNHIFNQLPAQYAEVLRLVGLGFKPGEIAKLKKREVQTVYKQIARGKAMLAEILRKEGYDGY